jgi:hypothetical protein
MKKLLLLSFILLGVSLDGLAQTAASSAKGQSLIDNISTIHHADEPKVKRSDSVIVQPALSVAGQRAVAMAVAHAEALAPTATEKAEDDYNLALIEYQQWTLRDLRTTYRWQNISSVIIFVMVILLVGAGIYFSWIQFKASGFKGVSSSLGATPQGVQLNTSVVGLIILGLSMGFFYMYLVYVYPINITNAAQALSAATKLTK